jgi:signal transduction histidine kinase
LSMLRVAVFSEDSEIQRLCRETLDQFADLDWAFTTPDETGEGLAPDVCIWDVHPGVTLPANLTLDNRFKNLFIVSREHIGDVAANLPAATAGVLLKPVTHTALRSFIEMAVRREQTGPADANAFMTARDEMLQCLLQVNLRLQEYDRDRTNFLARAAHDLRAPLTAASGYCGLMLNGLLGPLSEEQKEALRCVDRSVRRLTRMAAAMFELGIGRQVQGHTTFEAADLEATVAQVLHEIGPFSSEKHISITVDLGPAADELHFDSSQIEQVLLNLLDNACRFTPRRGSIEVSGYAYFWDRRVRNVSGCAFSDRRREDSRAPNCYRIDIRDSGPGIPPEHLDGIFEEYTPYANSNDRSGGGLALAVCKTIMEAHHGRVWAEPGPDGAVFCLVIPFRHPEPAPGARPAGMQTTSGVCAGAEEQ